MSSPVPDSLVSERLLEELSARGEAIYDAIIKPLLEPQYNNQYVVIHVDTEEYAIGQSPTRAHRAMLLRRPADGRLFGRKIGPEPDNDLFTRGAYQRLASRKTT